MSLVPVAATRRRARPHRRARLIVLRLTPRRHFESCGICVPRALLMY